MAPVLPHPSSCPGPTCLKDGKDQVVLRGSNELGEVSLGKKLWCEHVSTETGTAASLRALLGQCKVFELGCASIEVVKTGDINLGSASKSSPCKFGFC